MLWTHDLDNGLPYAILLQVCNNQANWCMQICLPKYRSAWVKKEKKCHSGDFIYTTADQKCSSVAHPYVRTSYSILFIWYMIKEKEKEI